jgi:hypothetical protein
MRATRRENISTVAGHTVWRQRSKLLLTPRSARAEMIRERRLHVTELDRMLNEEEANALERWAANEEGISGRAKTQRWDNSPTGTRRPMDCAPIPDHLIDRLNRHGRVKRCLDQHTLEILAAFTAMQNRDEGALSAAQYGLIYCPDVRENKTKFMLRLIVNAAKALVLVKY